MAYPVEPIHYEGLRPSKAHEDDAAFDLRADATLDVLPMNPTRVPCGLKVQIPAGCVGLICSRSGIAFHNAVFVLNAPGVIDPGYRGEVQVILLNVGPDPYRINQGDRIAQLLILPNTNLRMTERTLTATERGSNGFGSTGISSAPLYGRADLPDAS